MNLKLRNNRYKQHDVAELTALEYDGNVCGDRDVSPPELNEMTPLELAYIVDHVEPRKEKGVEPVDTVAEIRSSPFVPRRSSLDAPKGYRELSPREQGSIPGPLYELGAREGIAEGTVDIEGVAVRLAVWEANGAGVSDSELGGGTAIVEESTRYV
jgi:hypothetical protein